MEKEVNKADRCCKACKAYIMAHFSGNVRNTFITAITASILAYLPVIVNGYTCPDGILEGMMEFRNYGWDLALGRFMLRIYSMMSLNVIIPAFIVAMCAVISALCSMMIIDLWKIESRVSKVVTTVAITVAPAAVGQYLYLYMKLGYAFALLMSVAAAYFIMQCRPRIGIPAAAVMMAISFGGYQSYVGATAVIILLTMMLRLMVEHNVRDFFSKFISALISGMAGGIIYMLVWKVFCRIYHVSAASYGGADQISILNTLKKLGMSIPGAYNSFASWYMDNTGYRKYFFILLFLLLMISLICAGLKMITGRKFVCCILMVSCVGLIPLAMNIILIIAPDRNIYNIMTHQEVLIIPFSIAAYRADFIGRMAKIRQTFTVFVSLCIVWVFMICSFATFKVVELSYRSVDLTVNAIMSRIMNSEEYTPGTKILFAGFPDQSAVFNSDQFDYYVDSILEFSYWKQDAVFWHKVQGSTRCWPYYMYYYHGINVGKFTDEEYFDAIESDDFKKMGTWPAETSVMKHNDYIIVKFPGDIPDEPDINK